MKKLNLPGIATGDKHLERAVQLDPNVTKKPVPINRIVMDKLTYTVSEAAALLDLSAETIRRAIRAGDLKAFSGGSRSAYRISTVELAKWWKERGGGDLFGDG